MTWRCTREGPRLIDVRQANHELMLRIHSIVANNPHGGDPIIGGIAKLSIDQETIVPNEVADLEPDCLKFVGCSSSISRASTDCRDECAGKDPCKHDRAAMSLAAGRTKGTCSWHCQCQCHPRHFSSSPRWLDAVLGTLFYSNTGTPCLRIRSCNEPGCARRVVLSCQVTYHFPHWLVSKAITLSSVYNSLSGFAMTWSIGFPRSISVSHAAWRCIEFGDTERFAQLLRHGQVQVNDMADDDGTSLLLVSTFQLDR